MIEQRHQARQWLHLAGGEAAKHRLLLRHDFGTPLRRLVRQKLGADRRIRAPQQLPRGPRPVEDVAISPKDGIEGLDVQRIGVGQRAVDIEQQRSLSHGEAPRIRKFDRI